MEFKSLIGIVCLMVGISANATERQLLPTDSIRITKQEVIDPDSLLDSSAVNGIQPALPLIFTGPLVFNWKRRLKGLPVPRIDDGALAGNQPVDIARLKRWMSANITVAGRSDVVFVKLYCHGFFDHDQCVSVGEGARRFFSEIIEFGQKTGQFDVYFASAREAFNIALALIDGKRKRPGEYRNYRLKAIMKST